MATVIQEPTVNGVGNYNITLQLATVADDIIAWGAAPSQRDIQLRTFWPTEPMLASAVYSTAARYASFGYTLRGGPRSVNIAQRVLRSVENGQGWQALMIKILI